MALVPDVQYGLSSHSNFDERKSLIFVKLTDSSQRAIKEYLKIKVSASRCLSPLFTSGRSRISSRARLIAPCVCIYCVCMCVCTCGQAYRHDTARDGVTRARVAAYVCRNIVPRKENKRVGETPDRRVARSPYFVRNFVATTTSSRRRRLRRLRRARSPSPSLPLSLITVLFFPPPSFISRNPFSSKIMRERERSFEGRPLESLPNSCSLFLFFSLSPFFVRSEKTFLEGR